MKRARNLFVLIAFALIPIVSYGDIYAQSGYEEGQDGILLLTEKCSGAMGEADFKVAFIRANGSFMSGCYVKNNRGNFIVKWQNESVVEIPSNIFRINEKETEKPGAVPNGYYIQLYSGWKQGGPSRHDFVAKALREAPEFKPYQVSCMTGLDNTKSFSPAERDSYNKKHPYPKISSKCNGSGFILVGPFSSEQDLRSFTSEHPASEYDMHLYSSNVFCQNTCRELPK